jgi:uncharacterized protein YjeT (DUF2065 family)
MWDQLWIALALMLVLEGIMPFLSPAQFRRRLLDVTQMDDATLRIIGLISMILGLALLYLVH